MLYAFKDLAAIASRVLSIFKRERKYSRRHYTKFKPTPNNGRGKSILASIKLTDANDFRYRRKKMGLFILVVRSRMMDTGSITQPLITIESDSLGNVTV